MQPSVTQDGIALGCKDGFALGCEDGCMDTDGFAVGCEDDFAVGCEDGCMDTDGFALGCEDGCGDGRSLGPDEGSKDGPDEGADEGSLESTSPVSETIASVVMSVTFVTVANCPPEAIRSLRNTSDDTYAPTRASATSAFSLEYSPTVVSVSMFARLDAPTDVTHTAAFVHGSASDVPQMLPVFCAIKSLRAVESAVSTSPPVGSVAATTPPFRLKLSLAYLG